MGGVTRAIIFIICIGLCMVGCTVGLCMVGCIRRGIGSILWARAFFTGEGVATASKSGWRSWDHPFFKPSGLGGDGVLLLSKESLDIEDRASVGVSWPGTTGTVAGRV